MNRNSMVGEIMVHGFEAPSACDTQHTLFLGSSPQGDTMCALDPTKGSYLTSNFTVTSAEGLEYHVLPREKDYKTSPVHTMYPVWYWFVFPLLKPMFFADQPY